ncbi:hypothetical protein [Streptomyces sp. HGB0020]|nr:hypothetical protein [Streptomyces sp. HGB0020]
MDWNLIASQEVFAGGVMIALQLLCTVFLMGLDQLFQSRFGALGILCLFLLGVGVRARNTACLSVGAVVFVLLMTQA